MLQPEQIVNNFLNLRSLCVDMDAALGDVLDFYRSDLMDSSGKRVLGFQTAPAGKSIHHAYEGGLVVHILEMLEHINNFCVRWPSLSYRNMFIGAVLHDLHKGFCHYHVSDKGIEYYTHYYTRLMTPNQKTLAMISGSVPNAPLYHITADILHIISHSEGGWAENPPKEASIEAKLVYLADELSVVESRLADSRPLSIYDRTSDFFDFTYHNTIKESTNAG